jgi:ATP synthase protein I
MAMTVLMLVMAPRWIEDLSWPALLAGLIVTMKVYWLALVWGKPPADKSPSTHL